MIILLSVVSGFLHSWNQSTIVNQFSKIPDLTDSYGGVLSAIMYSASLLTVLLCKLPCKYCAIFIAISIATSNIISHLVVQRILIGLGCPHIFSFILYANLPYHKQISYLSYYNIACLFGTGLGILISIDQIYFLPLWGILLICFFFSKDFEKTPEVYLQKIVSIENIYLISFISELLGECVILSVPMVLDSVWQWQRFEIDYLLGFAHIIGIPVQVILTNKLYTGSQQLIVSSVGICGIASSMLTSLLYKILLQYVVGVCVAVIAVYFTRASICYFVTRAYGGMSYIKVAIAGIVAKVIAGALISVIDQENHEELNRNLFLPITLVIIMSLLVVNWNKNLYDNIKRN